MTQPTSVCMLCHASTFRESNYIFVAMEKKDNVLNLRLSGINALDFHLPALHVYIHCTLYRTSRNIEYVQYYTYVIRENTCFKVDNTGFPSACLPAAGQRVK